MPMRGNGLGGSCHSSRADPSLKPIQCATRDFRACLAVRAETARNTVREYQDFSLPELRELHNMQLALKRSLDNFSQELTQLTALRRSMDSFRQELVQMTVLLREIIGSAWRGQGPPAPPPARASEPADDRVYTPILVAQALGRCKVTIC